MNNGKKISLGLALLIGASVGYCSLPLTSYAVLIVAVTDQHARPMTADVSAIFLDRTGAPIVTITPQTVGSWANNLQWYTHSSNSNSIKRPEDAQQAVAVRIEAQGCDPITLPVELSRTHVPLSFSPHGGGPASTYYKFNGAAVLTCR